MGILLAFSLKQKLFNFEFLSIFLFIFFVLFVVEIILDL